MIKKAIAPLEAASLTFVDVKKLPSEIVATPPLGLESGEGEVEVEEEEDNFTPEAALHPIAQVRKIVHRIVPMIKTFRRPR